MAMDLVGQTLGDYEVEAHLGQGAMGTVYRGRHRETQQIAALKVMSTPDDQPRPALTARFEREIKLLSQFRHPNIVRVFGSSEDRGIRFYSMELIEGGTLADLIDRDKKLHFQKAVAIAVQVCEALEEIHKAGVVHRDLKPANLMIDSEERIKLTDFGIAKDINATNSTVITLPDHTVGTIVYMSPEQLSCEDLTNRSDIYSLGIILYQMLLGRLPFDAETQFDYLQQRLKGTFPLPSSISRDVPTEFDFLVRTMLAKNPSDRPRDASAVMRRLVEISKKGTSGTLTKRRSVSEGSLQDTVITPAAQTDADEAGQATVSDYAPLETPPSSIERSQSVWESPVFLVGGLLAALVFTIYMLWPPGPEELFAKGQELMASDVYTRWERAMTDYFEPLMEQYPDNPHGPQIAAYRARIALAKARARANKAQLLGRMPDDAGEAEKRYIEAIFAMRTVDGRKQARLQFEQLTNTYAEDSDQRPWVVLAQEQLKELDGTRTDK